MIADSSSTTRRRISFNSRGLNPWFHGLVAVETVEEEPVRPRNSGNPRHVESLSERMISGSRESAKSVQRWRSPAPTAARERRGRRWAQRVVRPRGCRRLVQRFRRDVGAVGPHDCTAFDEEPPEVARLLQGFEHRAFEPLCKVDRRFRVVIEHQVNVKRTVLPSPVSRSLRSQRRLANQ
jgi:hypothetical protein